MHGPSLTPTLAIQTEDTIMSNDKSKKPAATTNNTDKLAPVPSLEVEELPAGELDNIAGGFTVSPVDVGGTVEVHAKMT